MYNPWGGAGQQPQQQQQIAQPWGAAAGATAGQQQQQQQQAWGGDAAAAAAAAAQAAAAGGAYYQQQYYQQQAAAAGQQQQAAPPSAATYYGGAAAVQPAAAAPAPPAGVRMWTGSVTQIIPPNYGVIDGDAYYINAVVVGEVPKVGDQVRAEAVPNSEGAYKWRVTRLQLEAAAMAAQQAAVAAAAAAVAAAAQPLPGMRPGGGARGGARASNPADREKLREEAARTKYNAAAPPVAAYTSEVALASVETALGGTAAQAPAPTAEVAEKRALIAKATAGLDEGARKKAEQVIAQIGMDASNPGAKLLAKMGFGTVGTGLGRHQQGTSQPVEAVSQKPGTGLGFDHEKMAEEGHAAREARMAARDRERAARRSERPRSRSRSPGRGGRYAVSPPKQPTYEGERAQAAVSKRYKDLYLPSDFVKVLPAWQQSCPESRPYPIDRPISFDIREEAESPAAKAAPKSPAPAPAAPAPAAAKLSEAEVAEGRRWSAKVVLVGGVSPTNLEAGEKEGKLWVSPLKKITCLLVKHDKHEYGAIGGAWDPGDGGHPAADPAALPRTAARHFRAATGVDLSGCTQWLPFCEVQYARPESSSRGTPAHTEHVVLFLVDAWSVAQRSAEAEAQIQRARLAGGEEARSKGELAEAEAKLSELEAAAKAAAEKAAASKGGEASWEGLDPPTMNVQQLQEELGKRGLETKWNPLKGKKELVERLQEWIEAEKIKRAAEDADFKASEEAKAALEAQRDAVKEKDRVHREARAAARAADKLLQEPPALDKICVQAAGEALDKKGRSMLSAPSLDTLLDYDDEDYREHGFEVALFAEMFQEMLQQRFGRALMRALVAIDAAKLHRTKSRGDKQEESRKRERDTSAEPAAKPAAPGGDVEMADAGGGGGDAAKRQKTGDGSAAAAPGAPGGAVEKLLTACRFFDRELAGYIADEDLEEVAFMTCDHLSRKAVQTLVDAATKRAKFSYLEHASLAIPPAAPPAPAPGAAGTSGGVASDSGVVMINGAAVNVPVLQQRLAALEGNLRAAEDAQQAAEQQRVEAVAEKQRAQEKHEEAAIQLAHAQEQLAQLASTRSQADVDASKARVVLQAAELSLQELTRQVADAVAALGGGPAHVGGGKA